MGLADGRVEEELGGGPAAAEGLVGGRVEEELGGRPAEELGGGPEPAAVEEELGGGPDMSSSSSSKSERSSHRCKEI